MKERGLTLCQTEKKKAVHTLPVAGRNISRSYLFQWLGLLCSYCKWTATLPADPSSLGAIAVFTYVKTYWAKEGNALLFQNNIWGVNTPLKNLEEDQEGIQQRETLSM